MALKRDLFEELAELWSKSSMKDAWDVLANYKPEMTNHGIENAEATFIFAGPPILSPEMQHEQSLCDEIERFLLTLHPNGSFRCICFSPPGRHVSILTVTHILLADITHDKPVIQSFCNYDDFKRAAAITLMNTVCPVYGYDVAANSWQPVTMESLYG